MSDYDNVECRRCGHQWYSDKFEEEEELPEACPKCYQEEVRKIPEPPTKLDIAAEKLQKKREELPKQIAQKKHDMIIWKENNRFLLSMLKMASLLFLLVIGVVYLLFFR